MLPKLVKAIKIFSHKFQLSCHNVRDSKHQSWKRFDYVENLRKSRLHDIHMR